jgi:hypothetical protein
MLPHHNITGGMKCLVEHIRLLRARGHFTIAAHRCGGCLGGQHACVHAACVAVCTTPPPRPRARSITTHRSDSATRAMPPWTTVEADADVVCKLHQRLSDVYPVHDIDVVLVGIFHQV